MKAAILTNEYPPSIYGGAGIHVQFLVRELQAFCSIEARCFGEQPGIGLKARPGLTPTDARHAKILDPLDINLQMAASLQDIDLVHCHTWYSHFGGVLASRLHKVPLLLTTHSLEPHRPWKHEQLGHGGYAMSCWIERTAYQSADGIIAVSAQMKRDVMDLYGVSEDRVRIIYNGIDPDFYQPIFDAQLLRSKGIDPERPFVLFVGRITRQKGIAQLIKALPLIDARAQVVLCAGAPDTPEIAAESKAAIEEVQRVREGIVWIPDMMPHEQLRVLYSHAALFVTPSLYEPFGIINLEAMACGTPVVGSAVGGIPEIIVPGQTGLLVPLKSKSSTDFEPADPAAFQASLAASINQLLANPELCRTMGEASRKRATDVFGWSSIAKQTFEFYQQTVQRYSQEQG